MFMRASCFSSCLGLVVILNCIRAENWPAWRGPRGDGTSLETNVPIRWDATRQVLWKTAIPGQGHASPIVWRDRIFTVAALLESQDRVLVCLDRKTGEVLWQKTVLHSTLAKAAQKWLANRAPAIILVA